MLIDFLLGLKEVVLISVLGGQFLLTPVEININGTFNMRVDNISSINSGGFFKIDITKNIASSADEFASLDFIKIRGKVDTLFNNELVSIIISNKKQERLTFDDINIIVSDDSAFITLSAGKSIPVGTQYTLFEMNSSIPLTNILIYWVNFDK